MTAVAFSTFVNGFAAAVRSRTGAYLRHPPAADCRA
jgi:hypothetical protein